MIEGSYPIISKISECNNCPLEGLLTISVNVDGIPVFNSTSKAFWPILCILDQSKNKRPFVVALYLGDAKPNNSTEFLKEFIDECSHLENDGLEFNSVKYFFRISCFIADAPARSFLKNIVYFNSLNGCENFSQEAIHIGRTIWPYERHHPLRNDESFKQVYYDDHQRSQTILSQLDLRLVTQIPLDYMHLICLGVMKRLLLVWIDHGSFIPQKLQV